MEIGPNSGGSGRVPYDSVEEIERKLEEAKARMVTFQKKIQILNRMANLEEGTDDDLKQARELYEMTQRAVQLLERARTLRTDIQRLHNARRMIVDATCVVGVHEQRVHVFWFVGHPRRVGP